MNYNLSGSISQQLVEVFERAIVDNDVVRIDEVVIAHLIVYPQQGASDPIFHEYYGTRALNEIQNLIQGDTAELNNIAKELALKVAQSSENILGDWAYDEFAPETAYDLIMVIAVKERKDGSKIVAIAYFNDTEHSILEMLGTIKWKDVSDAMEAIKAMFQFQEASTEVPQPEIATPADDVEHIELPSGQPKSLKYEIKD